MAGLEPEHIVTDPGRPDPRTVCRRRGRLGTVHLVDHSHLFSDRLADFERELRALLIGTSPDGRFSLPLSENRLRIHRPHSSIPEQGSSDSELPRCHLAKEAPLAEDPEAALHSKP